MNDPSHPIWSLIRLAVLMTALVIVLWLQASSFDSNEIITLVAVFVAASTIEGAIKKMTEMK